MMKQTFILPGALLMFFLLNACQQEDKDPKQVSDATCAPLNPNGDSELALLMRKMASLAEENASALRQGKELAPYDGSFDKMLTAERSMQVEEQFFQGMAKSYITNINKLYQADSPEERVNLHNNLIQTCQECHGQTCRGPLKRIDKMLVQL
ncbi:MAG: hypothetical protein JNL88_05130 [Bacteroidia bacterium]|nr:hypothetical protein [Bacteroidia bacterium]